MAIDHSSVGKLGSAYNTLGTTTAVGVRTLPEKHVCVRLLTATMAGVPII